MMRGVSTWAVAVRHSGGHIAVESHPVVAWVTRSAVGKPELHIEVCSVCHPFYTGKQKVMDVGGRVDKFKKRYATKTAAP